MIAHTTPAKPAYLTYDLRVLELGDLAEEPLLQALVLVEVDADHPKYHEHAQRLSLACLSHLYRVNPAVTIHAEMTEEAARCQFPKKHSPQFAEGAGNAWVLSVIDRRGTESDYARVA